MMEQVVLLTDDEVRESLIRKVLISKKIKINSFKTRYESQLALETRSPTVFILDIGEDLSGDLSFLKTLTLVHPQTTFIALTSQVHLVEKATNESDNCIAIPLPLDLDVLLEVVESHLPEFSFETWFESFWIKVKDSFKWGRRVLRWTFILALALVLGGTLGYVYWCFATLPDVSLLEEYSPYQSSKIYSSDNVLLREFYLERRTFIPYDEIPDHVKNAFIVAEDTSFFKHPDIDPFRMMVALYKNLKEGAYVQGASTITQQLAKRIFLDPEKTITRKIQEIIIALKVEKKFTKEEILGLYLNQAYFGTRAYGIEAAAQVYFGKPVSEISVAEAALLAALPKSPLKYSPYINPEYSLNRRNRILKSLLKKKFIDRRSFERALFTELPTTLNGARFKAPYFVEFVRSHLLDRYGDRLYVSGLKIFSTLETDLQTAAERAVGGGVAELNLRGHSDIQAALIAVELETGKIRAMVGGTDFWKSQFNRATQAHRQPGSAFKPVVYLTALNRGYSPDSLISDVQRTYVSKGESWTPQNYHRYYLGDVTLRTAFALSLNAATVDLAKRIKLRNVIKTSEQLGIKSPVRPFYSSALGASEVTLLEMVYAYAAMANGYRMDPFFIEKIIDKEQNAVFEPVSIKEEVLTERARTGIRQMLRANVTEGTGKRANILGRPVYGKTGTSNDYADAWFIGFDNKYIVGVWVGRDSRIPIGDEETGSRAAIPIWLKFMNNLPSE